MTYEKEILAAKEKLENSLNFRRELQDLFREFRKKTLPIVREALPEALRETLVKELRIIVSDPNRRKPYISLEKAMGEIRDLREYTANREELVKDISLLKTKYRYNLRGQNDFINMKLSALQTGLPYKAEGKKHLSDLAEELASLGVDNLNKCTSTYVAFDLPTTECKLRPLLKRFMKPKEVNLLITEHLATLSHRAQQRKKRENQRESREALFEKNLPGYIKETINSLHPTARSNSLTYDFTNHVGTLFGRDLYKQGLRRDLYLSFKMINRLQKEIKVLKEEARKNGLRLQGLREIAISLLPVDEE